MLELFTIQCGGLGLCRPGGIRCSERRFQEKDDGEFSKGLLDPKPAFTALVVDACVRSPDRIREADHPWLARAVEAILSHRQEDGGIYTSGFGLDNYTTAISVMERREEYGAAARYSSLRSLRLCG